MSQQYDFVICNVPVLTHVFPAPAPAVLKGVLESNGFSCFTFDFNIRMKHFFEENASWSNQVEIDDFLSFQTNIRYSHHFDAFGKIEETKKNINKETFSLYEKFIKKCANEIIEHQPKWVGISVFSIQSVVFTYDLCKELKKQNQKIVLGGSGLKEQSHGQKRESHDFGKLFLDHNLADEIIYGEGEQKILNLARGVIFGDAHREKSFPDFSDFNDEYSSDEKMLTITGSTGCVRDCAFCDIKYMWNKYTFRKGHDIAKEIQYHFEKIGARKFIFSDSLVNGSISEFKNLCVEVIKLKEAGLLPENLELLGQFIFRPKKSFGEEIFDLMKKAGFSEIYVGVESGSTAVLHSMKKKYSREDIDFNMEMLYKYQINCRFMIVIGFANEGEKEFQETMSMIKDYKKYSDAGTILSINLSKTLAILENSPIGMHPEHWDVSFDETGNWSTPQNNKRDRIRRRYEAQLLCEELGYPIEWSLLHMRTIYANLSSSESNV